MNEPVKISKKLVKHYLQYPENCPFCNSLNIISTIKDDMATESYDIAVIYKQVNCNDCYMCWLTSYKLTDIFGAVYIDE
jgi:transcription elongation factor Elf1